MKSTSIQWADSTINPVAGCHGCPLFPSTTLVRRQAAQWLETFGIREARATVESVLGGLTLTSIYHLNESLAQAIADRTNLPDKLRDGLAKELRAPVKCYASILHMIRGKNPRNPGKTPHPGYAPVFEEPTRFPGRMAEAAKWSDLAGTNRPGGEWKGGLPRLIFVSDMGDALSANIPFTFLRDEIITSVTSPAGRRHVWLWLTKRPARMAKFDRWLADQGIEWPANLVPMTSVMDCRMAGGIKHLRSIRARARGLSVEPLIEQVTLDLEGIDWLIAGGESGTSARPFDLAWLRDLRSQCQVSGTAFFAKQLGKRPVDGGVPIKLRDGHGGDWDEWPANLRVREFPGVFQLLTKD